MSVLMERGLETKGEDVRLAGGQGDLPTHMVGIRGFHADEVARALQGHIAQTAIQRGMPP